MEGLDHISTKDLNLRSEICNIDIIDSDEKDICIIHLVTFNGIDTNLVHTIWIIKTVSIQKKEERLSRRIFILKKYLVIIVVDTSVRTIPIIIVVDTSVRILLSGLL